MVGLPLALAALAALNPAQNATVSIKADVMRVDQLVTEMAKQTGLPLQASPQTANDFVSIAWSNVTADTAMAALADACYGEWRPSGGVTFFGRDVSKVRQDAAKAQDEFATRIQPAIQGLDRFAQQAIQGAPAEGRQIFNQFNSLPSNKTIRDLVALVPRSEWEKIAIGQRVVFSSSPNRSQERLSGNLDRIVREYVESTQTFLQNQNSQPQGGQGGPGGNFMREIAGGGERFDQLRNNGASRVLLVIQRASNEFVSASFSFQDAQGNPLAFGFLPIPMALANPPVTESTEPKALELPDSVINDMKALGSSNPGIRFGQGLATVVTAIGSGSGNMEMIFAGAGNEEATPASASLRDRALKPADNEPLKAYVGPILGAYATAREVSMTAFIGDGLMSDFPTFLRNPKITDADVRAALREDYTVVEQNSKLTIRPKNMALALDARLDRRAFQRLNESMGGDSYTLDALSRYSLEAPIQTAENTMDRALAGLISSSAFQQVNDLYGANRIAYQFWGRMTAQQRELILQGQVMTTNGMGDAVRQQLSWTTYNDEPGPAPASQQNENRGPQTMIGMGGGRGGARMMGGFFGGPERTDYLPNGISSGVPVRATGNSAQVIRATSNDNRTTNVVDPRGLGVQRAMRQMGDGRNPMAQVEYDKFVVGTRRTIALTFEVSPGVTLTRSLREDAFPNTRPVSYDQLPQEIRQQAEEMTRRIQEGGGPRGGGNRGGGGVQGP